MEPASTATLPVEALNLPYLTDTLQQSTKRWVGHGSFGTVYSCKCTQRGQVAVKAITFPSSFDQAKEDEFLRKMRRELGIWKRLDHPNIVPLLGEAYGGDFGSDHPCMVSMWMSHGTLGDYIKDGAATLSVSSRIRLIKGSAAGLEYLHSKTIVHGDFHPANILIDSDHNPRITDFGFSQTLTRQELLTYLFTESIRPGAVMCVAPERLFPYLFPNLKNEATLNGDIYSFGSIFLYIVSGQLPWKDKAEAESQLEELNNPPRPPWPVIPDLVWDFIELCWSPRDPSKRPSAQEVLSFSRDRLEQLLQPNPASDINVVLFGTLGCGKSSIINLLAEQEIARVSKNMEPCTKRSRCYPISIGERRFRLWDSTGFRLTRGEDISPLSPYKQAHAVLRNLPDGVHLILLCAPKEELDSLGGLYWLINHFFFGDRAPIALVVTHFDNPEQHWWKRNHRAIVKNTGIPIQSIPHDCITTVRAGCDQSRQALVSFLEKCATSVTPIPLRLNISSLEAASHDIVTHCGLSKSDATALVDMFSRPRDQFNVVFFGKTGAGKSSVINLIAGHPAAQVTSDTEPCTLDSRSYTIDTPTKQFVVWDTVGFNGVRDGHDTTRDAVVKAVQLIRDLSAESGVDLLVFVKERNKLTTAELNCYRLLEELLCEGQVPVAVVVTHLEEHEVMEQWWEVNGEGLVKVLSGNVIGHACITSLESHDPEDSKFSAKLSESRLTVQALFEGCFACPLEEGNSAQSRTTEDGGINRVPEEMTVENLMSHCGLTRELAKDVIKLCNGSG